MTEIEIFDGLKEILHTIKPGMDLETVTMDSNLISDLGIDSLSILLLSLAVEKKYAFTFESVPPFSTVRDVVDYIAQKTR